MSDLIIELANAMAWAAQPQHSTTEAQKWAARQTSISPWGVWTLFALIRHRERQRWVAGIVQHRLKGSGPDLADAGALAHPEGVPQQGVVPGAIDWEYYFHGRGCCLTHRISGESIDVDFYDETGDWIDDWFYTYYLQSVKRRETVEARLVELHPSFDTLLFGIDELRALGLLEPHEDSKVFCVNKAADELEARLPQFVEAWLDPSRRLQAAIAIGDWPAGETFVAGRANDLALAVSQSAAACRFGRIEKLLEHYRQGNRPHDALVALAEINAPQLPEMLRAALAGPPSGAMNAALDLIAKSNDPAWLEEVFQLFRRLNPNRDIPEPAAWSRCAGILLRANHRMDDVVQALTKASHHEIAEAALLLLQFSPPEARRMFRLALRSSIPYNRITAAAALAILDETWTREELIALLRETSEQEPTAECRAALVCCSDPRVHAALLEWEQRNPYSPEPGPFYSYTDIAIRSRDETIQYEMSKLHDRVMPLRGRIT